jgi:hypothetical protein
MDDIYTMMYFHICISSPTKSCKGSIEIPPFVNLTVKKYKTEMFTYLLITVNTHIFVSLALQKRNNFRQEYGSIVLSDFVICCKLGHLSYLEKNVGAKGN